MTNEEREAIERLRKYHGKPLPTGEYQSAGHWHAVNLAVGVVLREHPADEDEPINQAWIEQHVLLEPYYLMGLYFWCDSGQWIARISGKANLCDVNTRGDVRRLCAALGIELEVKVTA